MLAEDLSVFLAMHEAIEHPYLLQAMACCRMIKVIYGSLLLIWEPVSQQKKNHPGTNKWFYDVRHTYYTSTRNQLAGGEGADDPLLVRRTRMLFLNCACFRTILENSAFLS